MEALDADCKAFKREWSIERALANIHPDDRERVRNKLNTAVVMGTDCHCKFQDTALANMRWLAIIGNPVFD